VTSPRTHLFRLARACREDCSKVIEGQATYGSAAESIGEGFPTIKFGIMIASDVCVGDGVLQLPTCFQGLVFVSTLQGSRWKGMCGSLLKNKIHIWSEDGFDRE
jgi:hypothetical protein